MPDEKSRLVYSTDRTVPRPGDTRKDKAVEKTVRKDGRPVQQKVTVRLERKGRGGKSVTVIEGLQMQQKERNALLNQLKSRFGTGGTVRDVSVEIQGDHCDALMAVLGKMGYAPKRSGG